jgi:RNA polymerase sigma-70 factor (ECF subfamily)
MFAERLLVWRFNRGGADALREIYDRHKDDLVTLAIGLLADKAEAEDVVQDVFVGFIRSAGKFRLTGSLKGFLATCVANRARNRNRAIQRLVGADASPLEAAAPEGERPDLAAIFGEEQRHVGGALAKLPYEQREAVLLHLQSGLKFRAIAQTQGVSISTVQGRYRYGLDRLRTLLDGKMNP